MNVKTMNVYTKEEVIKLIRAFQAKYNDTGCDGLPYYPTAIEIDLIGKIREKPTPYLDNE